MKKRLVLLIALVAIVSTLLVSVHPAEASGGWRNFHRVAEVIHARMSHQCWDTLPADATLEEINRSLKYCGTGVDDPVGSWKPIEVGR